MKITASNVSMYIGIIGGAPAVAWYVAAGQTIFKSWRASPDSIWPSIFAGLAVLCFVAMLIANAVAHSRMGAWFSKQAAATTATPNPQFLNVDDFYRTYDNIFLTEVENLVVQQSNRYQPGSDRERFLIRYSATILGTAIFEYVWLQMGGSQFRAIHAMNAHVLTLEDLHPFYDEGKASRPDFYEKYSFEQWLAFLRTSTFVVESGNTMQISIRGREFLKYVTHCGYDPSLKLG